MRRKKAPSPTPASPDPSWSSADPHVIESRLRSEDILLDVPTAQILRDRAASLLLSDPSRAYALSAALMVGARKRWSTLDPETRAIVWRCRAEGNLFTGRLRSARRAYERACTEAAAARAHHLLGQVLVGRVHLLSLMGDAAEANRLASRGERLLKKAGDLIYLGKLYMNRGNACYQREEHADALKAYRKAAQVFDRAGVRDATWVSLLMNQAIACTNLSRIEEARRLFLRTEAECDALGLESLRAHAHYNRAFLEAARGDYREALQLLEQSGTIFAQQDVRDMMAATQRARAEIYLELGMAEEARDLAGEAATAFSALGMPLDAALTRVHAARALLLLKQPERAVTILEDTERFYRTHRLRSRRASALLHQARAAMLSEDPRRAASLGRRARGIFERLGMQRAESQARRVIAETLLAQKRPRQAAELLAPALSRARYLPTGERRELWALAGRISRARGRRREAGVRLRRAVDCLEAERQLIPGTELRARAFEERVQVYHELLSLALEDPDVRFHTLYRLVEAARARGFRDRVLETRAAVSDGIEEKRAQLGWLVGQLQEAEYPERGLPDPAVLRTVQSRIQRLEREIGDAIRRGQGTRPGGPNWLGGSDPDTIAPLLRKHEALVEYFVSGDDLLVLVLRRDGRTHRLLRARSVAVREQVERVRFQIDALTLAAGQALPNPEFQRRSAEAALRDLHASLLEPIADVLPERGRLMLVPHQFLHRVPFECLWDGHDYIGDRYVLSRLPTADLLLRRTQGRRVRARGVLICGTVKSGPPAVAAELDAVAACFPGETARVMRDPKATEILDAMTRTRLLHLSAHGVFREDNPLFSRLSTGDGALFLVDLLGRRLNAELVVLSACNSGVAFTGQGDDLSGVAHGFLAAGARELVASQWRVHDEATLALMRAFYRHYTGGRRRDAAAALSAACAETRAEWDHPFYWGAFTVHGA